MPRKREFDIDAALDAAVTTFWERGFVGTSVRQLCEVMGLQPGSFYAAFGSKEECFRLAIERYIHTQGIPVRPGPDAIRRWFDAIVDPARSPRGCLLVNSAIEHAALDPANQALVSARVQALEDFFWLCLRERPRAREDAALLATAVAGIHVLARTGARSSHLRAIADRALDLLDS